MVKRTVSAPDQEPGQKTSERPSEKEHLFQVVKIFDESTDGNKFNLDQNTVIAECEVVGGKEEGRILRNRLSLDDEYKGFFATQFFLKAIGEDYKGENIIIDTDLWIGRQFYATVIHNTAKNGKTYANIDKYNFEKKIEQHDKKKDVVVKPEDIVWD